MHFRIIITLAFIEWIKKNLSFQENEKFFKHWTELEKEEDEEGRQQEQDLSYEWFVFKELGEYDFII